MPSGPGVAPTAATPATPANPANPANPAGPCAPGLALTLDPEPRFLPFESGKPPAGGEFQEGVDRFIRSLGPGSLQLLSRSAFELLRDVHGDTSRVHDALDRLGHTPLQVVVAGAKSAAATGAKVVRNAVNLDVVSALIDIVGAHSSETVRAYLSTPDTALAVATAVADALDLSRRADRGELSAPEATKSLAGIFSVFCETLGKALVLGQSTQHREAFDARTVDAKTPQELQSAATALDLAHHGTDLQAAYCKAVASFLQGVRQVVMAGQAGGTVADAFLKKRIAALQGISPGFMNDVQDHLNKQIARGGLDLAKALAITSASALQLAGDAQTITQAGAVASAIGQQLPEVRAQLQAAAESIQKTASWMMAGLVTFDGLQETLRCGHSGASKAFVLRPDTVRPEDIDPNLDVGTLDERHQQISALLAHLDRHYYADRGDLKVLKDLLEYTLHDLLPQSLLRQLSPGNEAATRVARHVAGLLARRGAGASVGLPAASAVPLAPAPAPAPAPAAAPAPAPAGRTAAAPPVTLDLEADGSDADGPFRVTTL